MLFIIIHQTYELWFKQLLHEFEKIKTDFPGADRLQERIGERTVIDHFYDFLEKRGAKIPAELKTRDLTQPNGPNEQVQKEILRLYNSSPELSILFELMTDFDEGLQE